MSSLPSARRYWKKVQSKIASGTGQTQDSEDLLHSAVLRLLDSSAKYDCANPAGLLLQTVRNLEIDAWRRRKRMLNHLPKYRFRCSAEAPSDPLQSLVDKTTLERALEVIGELPRPSREFFLMRHLDEVPIKEIAAHYGVSASLVEKQLRLVRNLLADWFEQEMARDNLAAITRDAG